MVQTRNSPCTGWQHEHKYHERFDLTVLRIFGTHNRRLNAVLPALGKMDPRWLRFGEHRDFRKRVLESSWLKDTIRAIDSECYGPDGEPKDSVDQDSLLPFTNNFANDAF
jgi:hypothetical protein